MSDNLTIFGTDYTGVTGIKAKGTGNGTLTYVRPTGTKSITENGTVDVTQYASANVNVPSSGVELPTFTMTFVDSRWTATCDMTYAECRALIEEGNIAANVTVPNGSYIWGAIGGWGNAENLLDYTVFDSSTFEAEAVIHYESDGIEVENAPTYNLQSKTATPTESAQTVTADADYYGLSSVTVDAISNTYVGSQVPRFTLSGDSDLTPSETRTLAMANGEYLEGGDLYIAAIPSTYVGSSITQRSSSDLTGSLQDSTYDVTAPAGYYDSDGTFSIPRRSGSNLTTSVSNGYLQLSYDQGYYPGGGKNLTTARTSNDLSISSTSGDTVIVPAGYYNAQYSKSVASGTQGIPTATKGTVSNHSITVTPSVTNSAGYISGGTKTGTAVRVSASELVSDTYTISNSGTHNITNYQLASVASGGATASATKGTVSNHSVTVTPSVTRTAGWVTAGSSNGTAVSVSASELVSGSQTITENGTVDVTNLAEVVVDIDTSSKYTATIGTLGAHRSYIKYNNVTYSANSSFEFSAGDSCTIEVYGEYGGARIYEDGTQIGTSNMNVIYTYVLPSCDIEIVTSATNTSDSTRVDISREDFVSLQSKTATPTTSQQVITADSGYDGLSSVTVEAISGTLSITANGTYDVADYAEASVSIPVGMTETELKTFLEQTSDFTDIDWPDGLKRIGSYVFAGYSFFNPSSLPSGVTYIGSYAFYNCTNLALTSLPSGLTSIGSSAFYNCTSLALTSLPSGLTSIGSYAFQNCGKLALTSLPSGITTISDSAFNGCTSLALTSLPSGLTSIGSYAFQNCTALSISEIPSSVTSIESNVFRGCTSITSISGDGSITSLGSGAFLGNTGKAMQLTSASFPNMAGVSNLNTVFGNATAANACQQLAFCDIGLTVGIMGSAFANCYALETLVLRKTNAVCTLVNVNAFTNTPLRGYDGKTGTVYVPEALIASYQTATNWSTLYNAGTVEFLAIEGSDYER